MEHETLMGGLNIQIDTGNKKKKEKANEKSDFLIKI